MKKILEKFNLGGILFTDAKCLVHYWLSLLGIILGPLVILVWIINIPLLIMRYQKVKKTLETGEEVIGKVDSKVFMLGFWVINFSYTLNSKKYKHHSIVAGVRMKLKKGMEVKIKYEKKRPSNAFVYELYK